MSHSYEEFFASGCQDSYNPLFSKQAKRVARLLPLFRSLVSLFFLIVAYLVKPLNGSLMMASLGVVYFLSGTEALIETYRDLKEWRINIDVLMTLAAFFSLLLGAGLEGGLLLVLFALSEGMEEMVSQKTKSAISELNQMVPSTAWVVESSGEQKQRPLHQIGIGTKIFVRAGEVVPLDGKVIQGSAFCNIAHITGETVPAVKQPGDSVPAGSILVDSSLLIEVTSKRQDSTLFKIIELITEAQKAKPRVQQFLDRFSGTYAKSIIGITFFFALFLPFFGIPLYGLNGSIYRALTFLIAASPCALIIATPTAYLSSISSAARKGVLLKGGIALDACAKCTQFAFDKTGTLTTGELDLIGIDQEGDSFPLEKALQIALSLERHSTHPIAASIERYATLKGISPLPMEEIEVVPGQGICGKIEIEGKLKSVFIGRHAALQEENRMNTTLSIEGHRTIFHFQDHVRPEAKEMVHELLRFGQVVMLTGDKRSNAERVGQSVGIRELFSDLTPEEKLRKIEELSKQNRLLMAGDGINDGPALARATCGVSIGTGVASQTAVEAADIVLMKNDLLLIPETIRHAKRTMRIVKQNLAIAFSVIFSITTPALLGWIPLWLAVVFHEGGTVLVGLNSLRLLLWPKRLTSYK